MSLSSIGASHEESSILSGSCNGQYCCERFRCDSVCSWLAWILARNWKEQKERKGVRKRQGKERQGERRRKNKGKSNSGKGKGNWAHKQHDQRWMEPIRCYCDHCWINSMHQEWTCWRSSVWFLRCLTCLDLVRRTGPSVKKTRCGRMMRVNGRHKSGGDAQEISQGAYATDQLWDIRVGESTAGERGIQVPCDADSSLSSIGASHEESSFLRNRQWKLQRSVLLREIQM